MILGVFFLEEIETNTKRRLFNQCCFKMAVHLRGEGAAAMTLTYGQPPAESDNSLRQQEEKVPPAVVVRAAGATLY